MVRKIEVPASIFDKVRSYATRVVAHEKGTGRRGALPGIAVGGKTGTAQVSRLGTQSKNERLKDHAWFVSFAPSDGEAQIALAIIVENSGHGGTFAAPVSRKVMATYFAKQGMITQDQLTVLLSDKEIDFSKVPAVVETEDEVSLRRARLVNPTDATAETALTEPNSGTSEGEQITASESG